MTTRQTANRWIRRFVGGQRLYRPKDRTYQRAVAIILVVLTSIGYGVYRHSQTVYPLAIPANTPRIPIADPLVEPDRPDLIGESRHDEE